MQEQNRVGERVRQLREIQKLSQAELAERSGNTVGQIQQIEAGELMPSLAPLVKIARALGVRLGTFLDDEEQEVPVIVRGGRSEAVVRFAGEGPASAEGTLEFFPLAVGKKDRHMEPFLVEVEPAQASEHSLSSHEGEEFIYVLSGAIELAYGTDTHVIAAGDSVYYDSVVPHHVHSAGTEPARIVAVVYAPL
jgi:transcriptional regulator with XRE-family HTH domain